MPLDQPAVEKPQGRIGTKPGMLRHHDCYSLFIEPHRYVRQIHTSFRNKFTIDAQPANPICQGAISKATVWDHILIRNPCTFPSDHSVHVILHEHCCPKAIVWCVLNISWIMGQPELAVVPVLLFEHYRLIKVGQFCLNICYQDSAWH